MVRRLCFIGGLGSVLGVAVAAGAAALAFAQSGAAAYPDHPIRVIVAVPAGGGVDTVTRIVTAKMQTFLGQPMVVENKAGVGGSIAAEYVFTSPPDGYTLLASQPSPITTNPLLYKSLNYDPAQLTPIVIMSHVPNVVLVREDFPAKTMQELIAYAKANPGKINYASQGIGTTSHTTAELFQKITQTKLVHVPYKGTAPALTDLLAGNVDLMFNELATSLELYKAGKARILAVTVKRRVPALPDIPTLEEAGVVGCDSDTWHALTAPPKTPADVIAKLNAIADKALADPVLLDDFAKLSISPGGGTPAEAAAFIKQETQRWSDVIRAAGIQPQ
jgi:tripartite-type tricarboxylate transporter receptor subunit TctC